MQFLKTFFASLLGTILGITLLLLILVAALVSSSSEPEPYIRANTVLTIKLSGDIPARAVTDPIQELLNPGLGASVSVESLKNNLKKAASHDNIAGVWITANQVTASWANLESVYHALEEFRDSGKFLYVSTDDIGMNEKAYMLASVADSIFYNPETNFFMEGFVAQITLYKGLLDKIGIQPEIFQIGDYKGIADPFMRESISDELRVQIEEILEAYTSAFIEAVMKRTGMTETDVNQFMDTPPVNRTRQAYENGLIDVLGYHDEVETAIKNRLGISEDDTFRTVSHGRYSRVSNSRAGLNEVSTTNKIAVIYASGTFLPQIAESPFGQSGNITSENFKKQIDAVLEDDDIKAIVVHINSPGGVATTSDLIWRHMKRAADKKPLIASMGTVAASAGYYMAAAADTIVAQRNTITGSIGVALQLFNADELLSDKLGLNFDTIKTHEFSDLFDLSRPLTQQEADLLQQRIEGSYERFLDVVAESRGMTRDEVHEIAQGRVYTGSRAHELGLVDVLGDLDTALEIAAKMADIDAYKIDVFPKQDDFFQQLFGSAEAQMRNVLFGWLPKDLRNEANTVNQMITHRDMSTWKMMPFSIQIN
jgi:protease IV